MVGIVGVRTASSKNVALYADGGVGVFRYTEEIRTGAVVLWGEIEGGLEVGPVRLGIRYARARDERFEDLLGHEHAYVAGVLGLRFPI